MFAHADNVEICTVKIDKSDKHSLLPLFRVLLENDWPLNFSPLLKDVKDPDALQFDDVDKGTCPNCLRNP